MWTVTTYLWFHFPPKMPLLYYEYQLPVHFFILYFRLKIASSVKEGSDLSKSVVNYLLPFLAEVTCLN